MRSGTDAATEGVGTRVNVRFELWRMLRSVPVRGFVTGSKVREDSPRRSGNVRPATHL
jgi:hypothetical protein